MKGLLDEYLIPGASGESDASDAEAAAECVFYLKMKGDYYRYLAEVYKDDAKKGRLNVASGQFYEAGNFNKVDSEGPSSHHTS